MIGVRNCVGLAISTAVAACGFNPQPKSGVVACNPSGGACCPDGYICVGRGESAASGPSLGTCWYKEDLPMTALASTHDYTPTVLYDPPCLVTDWPFDVGVDGTPDSGAAGPSDTGGTGGAADGDPDVSPDSGDPSVSQPVGVGSLSVLDPGIVYITGNFDKKDPKTGTVTTYTGIFDTTDISRFAAIFPKGVWGNVHPDGTIAYIGFQSTGDSEVYLRQFVSDPDLAKDPKANDIALDLPTCPGGQRVDTWYTSVAPDTGDTLFQCHYCPPTGGSCYSPSDSTDSYCYQRSGVCMELTTVLAVGAGGRYLATGRNITDPGLRIINPDGSKIPVVGGPKGLGAIRVTPTGFWVLDIQGIDDGDMSRWHIAYDGTITEHVSYPPSPIPVQVYYWRTALDGQGRAVTAQMDTNLPDRSPSVGRTIILRFDPSASSAEVLFDMANPPSIVTTLNLDLDAEMNRFFTGP